jgi:hypothetical protein
VFYVFQSLAPFFLSSSNLCFKPENLLFNSSDLLSILRWSQLNASPKIRNRPLYLPQSLVGKPTVEVGRCIPRIEIDDLIKIRNRLFVLPKISVGNPAVEVGVCIPRIEREGLVVLRNRSLKLPKISVY